MPINQADTAWMLVSTALVLLMTPALAFFYGGLVRAKNAGGTLLRHIADLSLATLAFWAIGMAVLQAPYGKFPPINWRVIPNTFGFLGSAPCCASKRM